MKATERFAKAVQAASLRVESDKRNKNQELTALAAHDPEEARRRVGLHFSNVFEGEVFKNTANVLEACGVLAEVNRRFPPGNRSPNGERCFMGALWAVRHHATAFIESCTLEQTVQVSHGEIRDALERCEVGEIAASEIITAARLRLHETLAEQMGEDGYNAWFSAQLEANKGLPKGAALEKSHRALLRELQL